MNKNPYQIVMFADDYSPMCGVFGVDWGIIEES